MGRHAFVHALIVLALVACSDAPQLDPTPGLTDDAGGAAADGAPDTGAATAATIAGRVVDEFGVPVPAAEARVGAMAATTGADGRFTLLAPPSYDLVVVAPAQRAAKKVTVLRGLTTRTPTLQVEAAPRQVAVRWTLGFSSTSFPLPANDRIAFVFAPSTDTRLGSLLVTSAIPYNAIAFPMPSWTGATIASGSAHGYRYAVDGATGLPTSFAASGFLASFYTYADATSMFDMALQQAVATAALQASVDAKGQALAGESVAFSPAPSARHWIDASTPLASLTTTLPAGSEFDASVAVRGAPPGGGSTWAWRHGLKANGAAYPKVDLALPSAIALQAPADAASAVDAATAFSWSAAAGGAYALVVRCPATAPYAYYAEIVTTQTSTTLPDAGAAGVPPAAGATCAWTVEAFAPASSTDELAGARGYRDRLEHRYGTADGTCSLSPSRTFVAK